jgi:hypothetical protein
MSFVRLPLRVFSFVALFLAAVGSGTTKDTSVVLCLLDGKNGKSIGNEHLLVFYGTTAEDVHAEKNHRDLRTDINGKSVLTLDDSSILLIQVFSDGHILCQQKSNTDSYSVEQIKRTGLSTQNTCGPVHRENTPDQFVIYARPATFWEKMRQ